MTRRQLPRGLYLLTPDEHDGERLLARTLPLLPFASCVQLRARACSMQRLTRKRW